VNQPPAPLTPAEPNQDGGFSPVFESKLLLRHRKGRVWKIIFQAATLLGIIFLALLLYNILNQSFGYVAFEDKVPPASLAVAGVSVEDLDQAALIAIVQGNISKGLLRKLENEQPLTKRGRQELYQLVLAYVIQPQVVKTWSLSASLLRRSAIHAEVAGELAQAHPHVYLRFTSWFDPQFLSSPQSSDPISAGVRTAALGSLWTIGITILVAFPVGVGAAIYLEEYASNNWLNRVIQTNINNLAGVPSIIYGMLGLAVFVRTLVQFTSGALFGAVDPSTTANGRTILSAGLTLALLVLPLIIINGQEAIRAVPNSLRQASYGIGATKWQTTWHHVLPNAMPGILTGTILAVSRAIGETAPLVVVGAATFINKDPNGPFSQFTTLPIQIYQWTARAQSEFRSLAAAAILVLLILLLSLNAAAIVLRNRFSKAGGH